MEYETNFPPVEFFTPKVIKRVWGDEVVVAVIPGICMGKILKMKAGTRGGFQYHRKNEAGHLVSGTLKVEVGHADGTKSEMTVNAGESIVIPAGAVHRETAITDCIIFEIGQPFLNDRVRMEQFYGEKIDGGLPSTTPEEIEKL